MPGVHGQPRRPGVGRGPAQALQRGIRGGIGVGILPGMQLHSGDAEARGLLALMLLHEPVVLPLHPRTRDTKSPALDPDSILQDHHGAAIILDLHGQLLAANSAAVQLMTGDAHLDLRGRPLTDFLAADSCPRWQMAFDRMLADRLESHIMLDLRANDRPAARDELPGPLRPSRVELVSRPIVHRRRVVAVQSDLQQVAADPAPGDLLDTIEWREVLEGMCDPVLALDHAGVICWTNAAFAVTGYRPAALIGRPLIDLIVESDHDQTQRLLDELAADRAAESSSRLHVEVSLRCADGRIDRVDLSGRPDAARDTLILTCAWIDAPDAKLRARYARLEALNAVAAIVGRSLDASEALHAALRTTLDVMRTEAGAVALVDPANGDLVFEAKIGWRKHDRVGQDVRVKAGQGISRQVVELDQPLVTGDVWLDEDVMMAEFQAEEAQALALAPMHTRSRVIGVLSVMDYSPRVFTSDDVKVLCAIADQIGVGIENAQLYQAEQRQRQLAEALRQVTAVLNSTLELNKVLDLIVSQLKAVVPYDRVSLWLIEGDRVEIAVARGYNDAGRPTRYAGYSELLTTRALIELHEPLNVADTRTDPRWQSIVEPEQIRSWLGVPLLSKAKDQVLGILGIDSHRPNAYSDDDVRAAFVFADQAAVAISNARLYAESQRRADLMAVLNSMSATVSQSLELEPTLWTALDTALEVVGVEAGAISLVDEEAQELVIRVHRGWRQQDLPAGLRIKLGHGLSGQAAVTGEVVVTGSLENEPRLAVPEVRDEGVQSMVLAPMHARGRVVGVLGVMSYRAQVFDPQSIEVVKSIADQIGLAIDNARLFDRETRRSAQLALINEVARDVVSTLELNERFDRATQTICEQFGYYAVGLFMVDLDVRSRRLVMRLSPPTSNL